MRQTIQRALAGVVVAVMLAGCGGTTTAPAPTPPAAAKTTSVTATTPVAKTTPGPGATPATRTTPAANGTPQAPAKSGTPAAGGTPVTNPAIQAAIQALAQQRNITSASIRFVSLEEVEWADTSLNCPEPGRAYAQVITPGYRVTLEANGQRVEYHTTRAGDRVVTC